MIPSPAAGPAGRAARSRPCDALTPAARASPLTKPHVGGPTRLAVSRLPRFGGHPRPAASRRHRFRGMKLSSGLQPVRAGPALFDERRPGRVAAEAAQPLAALPTDEFGCEKPAAGGAGPGSSTAAREASQRRRGHDRHQRAMAAGPRHLAATAIGFVLVRFASSPSDGGQGWRGAVRDTVRPLNCGWRE
jgi:hypothetical protein